MIVSHKPEVCINIYSRDTSKGKIILTLNVVLNVKHLLYAMDISEAKCRLKSSAFLPTGPTCFYKNILFKKVRDKTFKDAFLGQSIINQGFIYMVD